MMEVICSLADRCYLAGTVTNCLYFPHRMSLELGELKGILKIPILKILVFIEIPPQRPLHLGAQHFIPQPAHPIFKCLI